MKHFEESVLGVASSPCAGRRCLSFGVLCFLCAIIASSFGAESALADAPPAAIKTTQLAAPATVLGLTNPYLVAAAMKTPEVRRFTVSQDILDLAAHVEKLARYGVDLNQRKKLHTEKIQLRVKPRGVGWRASDLLPAVGSGPTATA